MRFYCDKRQGYLPEIRNKRCNKTSVSVILPPRERFCFIRKLVLFPALKFNCFSLDVSYRFGNYFQFAIRVCQCKYKLFCSLFYHWPSFTIKRLRRIVEEITNKFHATMFYTNFRPTNYGTHKQRH